MNAPRSTRRRQAAAVLALLAAVAITAAAASALQNGGATAPDPTDRPSAAPSSSPNPSVAPTTPPRTTPPNTSGAVDLENATDHDVSILIHDQIGVLDTAVSGKPGDGMSVGWHKALVENVDAETIRVTWVGLPGDDVADLGISGAAGAYALTIVQPGPVPYSDAMGEDRVLVLTFDAPVSADDVSVEILDRTVD